MREEVHIQAGSSKLCINIKECIFVCAIQTKRNDFEGEERGLVKDHHERGEHHQTQQQHLYGSIG